MLTEYETTIRLADAIKQQIAFSAEIKLILQHDNMTQVQIAKNLGESKRTVNYWIHRGSLPRRIYNYIFIHNRAMEIKKELGEIKD